MSGIKWNIRRRAKERKKTEIKKKGSADHIARKTTDIEADQKGFNYCS